ncbi:MAG: UvrD-helicase domain-containing protein, partial [Bacteroidales bacterium]
MGPGTLTVYSASAGSGKTHTLTGIYLKSLFRSRFSYRRILAVTFTHKSTAEMKGRILDELNNLATGSPSEFLAGLTKSTGKPEEAVRREAGEILIAILHDFSRFSVSTIDSFFQKIIRAFARDIGLHSGFDIELDHTAILESAVDRMIDSASDDTR